MKSGLDRWSTWEELGSAQHKIALHAGTIAQVDIPCALLMDLLFSKTYRSLQFLLQQDTKTQQPLQRGERC